MVSFKHHLGHYITTASILAVLSLLVIFTTAIDDDTPIFPPSPFFRTGAPPFSDHHRHHRNHSGSIPTDFTSRRRNNHPNVSTPPDVDPNKQRIERLDLFFSTITTIPLNTTEINSTFLQYFAQSNEITPIDSTSNDVTVSNPTNPNNTPSNNNPLTPTSTTTNNTPNTTNLTPTTTTPAPPPSFYGFELPPLLSFDFTIDHIGLSLNGFNITKVDVGAIERQHSTRTPQDFILTPITSTPAPPDRSDKVDSISTHLTPYISPSSAFSSLLSPSSFSSLLSPSSSSSFSSSSGSSPALSPHPTFIIPQNRFEMKVSNITIQGHSDWLLYIHKFPVVQDCGRLDIIFRQVNVTLSLQQVNVTNYNPKLLPEHFNTTEDYDNAVEMYQESRAFPRYNNGNNDRNNRNNNNNRNAGNLHKLRNRNNSSYTPNPPPLPSNSASFDSNNNANNTNNTSSPPNSMYIPPFFGLFVAYNKSDEYRPIRYPGLTQQGNDFYEHMIRNEQEIQFINHYTNETETHWISKNRNSLVTLENQRFMLGVEVTIDYSRIHLSWTLMSSIYNFFLARFNTTINNAIASSCSFQLYNALIPHIRTGYDAFQNVQSKIAETISDKLSSFLNNLQPTHHHHNSPPRYDTPTNSNNFSNNNNPFGSIDISSLSGLLGLSGLMGNIGTTMP